MYKPLKKQFLIGDGLWDIYRSGKGSIYLYSFWKKAEASFRDCVTKGKKRKAAGVSINHYEYHSMKHSKIRS